MIEYLQILEPILFNPLKHYLPFIKEFTEKNANAFLLNEQDVKEISSLIMSTAMIPENIIEKTGDDLEGARIIATADLIGQMADRAYLEKLIGQVNAHEKVEVLTDANVTGFGANIVFSF